MSDATKAAIAKREAAKRPKPKVTAEPKPKAEKDPDQA